MSFVINCNKLSKYKSLSKQTIWIIQEKKKLCVSLSIVFLRYMSGKSHSIEQADQVKATFINNGKNVIADEKNNFEERALLHYYKFLNVFRG